MRLKLAGGKPNVVPPDGLSVSEGCAPGHKHRKVCTDDTEWRKEAKARIKTLSFDSAGSVSKCTPSTTLFNFFRNISLDGISHVVLFHIKSSHI